MGRAVAFFVFCFAVGAIITGVMQGGGGISVTSLTSAVSASATTIPVSSTKGFLGSSVVWIGDEQIDYSSTDANNFLSCTRGYNGSTAATHSSGDKAKTGDSQTVNQALGFDIVKETERFGPASAISIPVRIMTTTLPRLFVSNFYFLQGDLAPLALFFYASAAGLIVTIALAVFRGVG